MEKINKILLIVILILGIIIFIIGKRNTNEQYDNIIHHDTIYQKNLIILDSIEYNIKVKDSVITVLKEQMEYEITEAVNANNNDIVEQFKQLVSE